jgi:hypothetical protein
LYSGDYYVYTNAQLLGLSKCTSIDYLRIESCTDCTQAAWCGLQLQSITGKDPLYGVSLYLHNTPGFSDMCGVRNLNGALTGAFKVNIMNGVVSLDGAEGITSVGVSSVGRSIYLNTNPILTSAIALTNTTYPAGTLLINNNPDLECVPSAWPATDKDGRTIPHGSCPTTPAPTPAQKTAPTPAPTPASGGWGQVPLIVGIVIVALALVFFFLPNRWEEENTKDEDCCTCTCFLLSNHAPKTTKDVEMSAVEVDLPAGLHPVEAAPVIFDI